MRLATVRTPHGTRAAVQRDSTWVLLKDNNLSSLFSHADWRSQAEKALGETEHEDIQLADAELHTPLPNAAKIVCCGLNYRDHIVETGRDVPEYPTLFAKYADTQIGPNDQIEVGDDSIQVDWEAELAVIVGSPIRRATRAQATAAILGYTVANDVSYRDWQGRTLQWFQGKAWAETTPIGPVVVTADELDPAAGLEIKSEIDGVVMQQSNTRELVFDAADLVAYVSQFTPLAPGDIVLTGTPGGVGLGMRPQRWLQHGEVLRTSIEGIGELRNRISMSTTHEGENQS
ncbi:fumarylacetoacetate hydrolase family protein [Leucobacter sp. UT-8R-CII-1-4]|uniref:fumarylacetoacetate hydrolase family protein n=1 Tax=Leucobacter sp. UT-8R-CII-1-4 TaxID=3040075 RepID=UPI0024A974ED|nr:fumarylacetoacetate hydrolase family protein [Leucobacter sp. UT-8R-CII-1-4]MDI6023489.1 fumarylacetoacetate hydrolase family protein [Leucobacter sp. UT-8R-CII-1-4]